MYAPETTWTRAFLSVAVIQALVASSLEAYVLISVERCFEPEVVQVARGHTVPMFFALFIFGFIYQLVLVYDPLRSSSMIQIVGLCLYNLCLLVYAIFQPKEVKEALDSLAGSRTWEGKPLITPGTNAWGDSKPALIALPMVVGLATAAFCFVAWKLRSEFAWLVYKAINADLGMKKRVLILQSYVALLKFDLFFLLGFLVQNTVYASANMGDPEFGLSIGFILVVLLVVWLAVVCAQRENKFGTVVIIIAHLAAAGFLCWKLTTISPAVYMFLAFPAITLAMTLCTISMAVLALFNFGKGVKTFTESQQRQFQQNLEETDYASLSYLYGGYVPPHHQQDLHSSNDVHSPKTASPKRASSEANPPHTNPGGTPCGVPAGEKTIFVLADPHDPIDRCYLAISYDVSDGKTPQISDPTNDDYRWIVYEYIDPALTVFKLANPYAYHMGLKAEDERWAPPTDVTTRVITQKWQVQFEREISSFPSAKFTGHIKGVIDYYVMCEPPVVLTKRGFVEALVERIKRDGLPLFPDEHGFASSSLLENSGGKKLDELFGPPLEVPEGYKRLKQNQGEAQRQRKYVWKGKGQGREGGV